VAQGDVKVNVNVDDKGTLKKVGSSADRAAKGVNRLSQATDQGNRSRNVFNKLEKGTAGLTSNSTKAFAKQAQTVGGVLVPAYATLAANIFAISAAFNALAGAARLEQLEAGLLAMGEASGIALGQVSAGLKEATQNAISMEEAMRATAMVSSAGFGSDTIERLGNVARSTALALGRDTTDALNRLTRGAVKLEPELLDELGIMVRLDEAVRSYAQQNNMAASSLGLAERRQAFMNAVLEEGERKFKAVEAAVDVNVYDQLAAKFSEVSKAIFTGINNVAEPVVRLLANSTAVLVAAMALLGSTIASKVVPVFSMFATKQTDMLKATQKTQDANLKLVGSLDRDTEAFKKLKGAIKDGTVSYDKLKAAQDGLYGGKGGMANLEKLERTGTITKREAKQLTKLRATYAELGKAMKQHEAVKRQEQRSTALNAASTGQYKVALQNLRLALKGYQADAAKTIATNGALAGSFKALAIGAKALKLSLATLGAALLSSLAWIGLAISAFVFLKQKYDEYKESLLTDEQKKFREETQKLSETMDELAPSLVQSNNAMQGQDSIIGGVAEGYIAFRNSAQQALEIVKKLNETGEDAGADDARVQTLQTFIDKSDALRASFQDKYNTTSVVEAFKDVEGMGMAAGKALEEYTKAGIILGNKSENLKDSLAKQATAFAKLRNKFIPKTEYDEMSDSLNTFKSELDAAFKVDSAAATSIFLEMVSKMDAGTARLLNINQEAITKLQQQLNEINAAGEQDTANFKKRLQEIRDEKASLTRTTLFGETEVRRGAYGKDEEANRARLAELTREEAELTQNIISGNQERAEQAEEARTQLEAEARASREAANAEIERLKILRQSAALRKVNRDLVKQTFKSAKAVADRETLVNLKYAERAVSRSQELEDIDEQIRQLEMTKETNGELLAIQDRQLAVLRAQRAAIMDQNVLAIEQKELAVDLAKVNLQNLQDTLKGQQAIIAATEKRNKALTSIAEAELRIAQAQRKMENLTSPRAGRTGELTPADEAEFAAQVRDNKIAIQRLQIEKQINEARLTVIEAELRLLAEKTKDPTLKDALEGSAANIASVRGGLGADMDAQVKALQMGLAATIAEAGVEFGQTLRDALTASISAEGSIVDRIMALFDTGGAFAEGTKSTLNDQVQGMINAFQPLLEFMGPEGLLLTTMVNATGAISQTWADAFKNIEDNQNNFEEGTKRNQYIAAEILSGVGATIGQIGQIAAAASQQRVAAIDAEIAAEQKRDGKSAQSKAKIKALEAKREREKRKAFETDKKMKMAQTVINTAASVMAFMAQANIPMAIAAGVMGAIQLAIIAGTSYQGGGSGSTGAAGPSGIRAGERSNTVDFARSTSPAGELAYMRGERGQGTSASNFVPGGFAGKQYRAFGGNTGFMVGEQGPEMFVPNRPGTVIPADDTARMGGGGGGMNITFNVSAIDSQGVEDFINGSRGQIIESIREAANSQGEFFLESVDTFDIKSQKFDYSVGVDKR
jgi:hypothetical protein